MCDAGSLSCACAEKAAAETRSEMRRVLSFSNFILYLVFSGKKCGEIGFGE